MTKKARLFNIYERVKTVTENEINGSIEQELEHEFGISNDMEESDTKIELFRGIYGLGFIEARELLEDEEYDAELEGVKNSLKDSALEPGNHTHLNKDELRPLAQTYLARAQDYGIDRSEYFSNHPALLERDELEKSFLNLVDKMAVETAESVTAEAYG